MHRLMEGKPSEELADCEFDLAVDAAEPRHAASPERTGTVPYIALDSLVEERATHHLYRHDLEAFAWVSVWLAVCYKDGTLRKDHPLRAWQTGNYLTCSEKKSSCR